MRLLFIVTNMTMRSYFTGKYIFLNALDDSNPTLEWDKIECPNELIWDLCCLDE